MADNIQLNAGQDGDVLAADDIGPGVKFQRVKLVHGADGTNDGDVSKANPIPIGVNTVKDGSGTLYAPLCDDAGNLQVDIVGALPIGSNAIGKLAANTGVDIGDVDVLSLPSTTFVAGDGAYGLGVLIQGDDGTDRHNVACDTSGYLKVDLANQSDAADLKVTLDSEEVVLGTGSAAIGKLAANTGVDIGDVDVTSLPSTTFVAGDGAYGLGVLIQGDDGSDRHNLACDASGYLKVDLANQSDAADLKITLDSEAVVLGTGSAAIGKLAANTGVDIGDVDVTSISAGDNNIGNVDIVTLPSGNLGQRAMEASLSVVPANNITDTTYIGDIKFGEALPEGTNSIGQVEVVGDAAHDAAAAGNPVLLGAEALSAERAVVATTDVTKLVADLVGKLIVLPYSIPELLVSGTTGASPLTTDAEGSIIATPGAGVKLFITHVAIINGHDTVGTRVDLLDGTAGSVLYSVWAEQTGGGASVTFPTPLVLTANKALFAKCATTGASVNVSALGYKGA